MSDVSPVPVVAIYGTVILRADEFVRASYPVMLGPDGGVVETPAGFEGRPLGHALTTAYAGENVKVQGYGAGPDLARLWSDPDFPQPDPEIEALKEEALWKIAEAHAQGWTVTLMADGEVVAEIPPPRRPG